ncbi:organic cation transporter protein-like [Patiria miniata]|uniref:Major facilitator superfamily (MFS) profile domain-containing protein n=1 Tax=Patiria miniata TaxID=46514 RepID=A0A914BBU7_PATMI|nr:organic cation transporter protein-like [Patiria miniata]
MAMELDEALVFLGDFGRYQTLIYVLICLAGQVPSAWHMLAISFLGAVPGHRCKVPAGQSLEETVPTVVGKDGGEEFAECLKYLNRSAYNETIPCDDGWDYDSTYYGKTIATEWDLVCERDASVELSQIIFMLGVMVGSLLFGQLSDRFGRRYVFFFSLWAQVAFGVGAAFTGNLYAFMAVRFAVGVIEQGVDITSYVMVTEMFSPSRRAFAGILLTLFWSSGIMSLAGLAYLLRDWRHLQLTITLPSLLTIPLWWVIPESMRWLMSRGRVREAEAILRRIARFNKVDLPDGVLTEDGGSTPPPEYAELERKEKSLMPNDSSSSADTQGHSVMEAKNQAGLEIADVAVKASGEGCDAIDAVQTGGEDGGPKGEDSTRPAGEGKDRVYTLWHLFRTPKIRRISLVMIFTWFVNSLVYYGLSLNTDSLAGNPYLNFFLSGAVEIPAYIVSSAVVTWFGRRLPLCIFHVAGGIACIVTAFIPPTTADGTDLSALIVTTAMLGKFGIAGSYAIVFLYATELFPTVARNLGVGMSSFSSRVGGILAPIIMYLEKFTGWIPLVIFGGTSIIAGLSVLVLDETLGKKQPQTIEDVERTQTGT